MKTAIEYIKEAWGIYTKKENFVFFAKIMAVLVIATSVLGFVTSYFYPADYLKNSDFSNIPMFVGFVAISLLAGILGLWSQTTQYFAILKMGNPEKEIFKFGYKNMWRFFLVSLLIGLIVGIGLLLLIVPGFIWGTWYIFSTLLVLDKNMGIKESLKASKLMVQGKFWAITGRVLLIGLISFIMSLILTAIPYAGTLIVSFISPLFLLPFYLLYRDLSVIN